MRMNGIIMYMLIRQTACPINLAEPVQVQPADEYPDWVMEAFQALRETGINLGTPERIGLSGSPDLKSISQRPRLSILEAGAF